MKGIITLYTKHKRIVIWISVILLVVLFALPIITKRNMKIASSYTKKEDVALYIIQHHELPTNYITMYGLNYLKNNNMEYEDCVVGGDTHINTNELSSLGIKKNITLKECDIKGDIYDLKNNNRGSLRLVYTCNSKNVRVFYTSDHYENFVELSEFKLQLTSNIFWIIFGAYLLTFVSFYIIVFADRKRSL